MTAVLHAIRVTSLIHYPGLLVVIAVLKLS